MLHILPATKKTVHCGYFDAGLAPVLTVKSGDLVKIEAVTHHAGDAPELLMDEGIRQLYRDVPEADRFPGVHIMTGPIFVEGAKPGDMLEVRILDVAFRVPYGMNAIGPGSGVLPELLTERVAPVIRLDLERNVAGKARGA